MLPDRKSLHRLRDELLLDASTVGLAPHEERVLDLLTKILAGGVLLWVSISELLAEINRYRAYRATTRTADVTSLRPPDPGP